jgi:hypothetical protein
LNRFKIIEEELIFERQQDKGDISEEFNFKPIPEDDIPF